MKKSAPLLLTFTSLLFFNNLSSAQPQQPVEPRLAALEAANAERNRVIPSLSADHIFFANAAYLFWHMHEDGLPSAYTITNHTTDAGSSVELDQLGFDWNSGFRVGIGYRMPHDHWELNVVWTRLDSRAASSELFQGPDNSTVDLGSPWLPNIDWAPTDSTLNIRSALKVHLNVLDSELARFVQVTPRFALKPHAGVRGLWITQSYTVSGTGGEIQNSEGLFLASLSSSTNNSSSQCRGLGMRAGIDGSFEFCKHWTLYSNVGGSLLCTTFHLKNTETTYLLSGPLYGIFNSKTTQHGVILPTLDFALGIGWDYSFGDKAALGIRAGWEFNDFFNQNRMPGIINIPESFFSTFSENLQYQGLTFNIRLDF